MKYEEKTKQKLNNCLEQLNIFIMDYYIKANISYYETKKFIENSIDKIKDLLEKSINITYQEINNKYISIKNNFESIKYNFKNKKTIDIEKHEEKVYEINYIIETKIDEFLLDNEIIVDLILEKGDIISPKIIGKIINKNHPKKMIIDFFTNYGQTCEIKGRQMIINFNNISLISEFLFDSNYNNITINHNIEFDEYNIKNEKYIIRENKIDFVVCGIRFTFPNICKRSLDGETEIQVINSVKNSILDIYLY